MPSYRRYLQPSVLFAYSVPAASGTGSSAASHPGKYTYLDGLRGLAALQVYLFHFWPRYTAYGHCYNSTPEDRYLHQLPIFRVLWASGSSAVSVFFVISGFVLSVQSLALLRKAGAASAAADDGQAASIRVKLYDGLASSLFRRGFRLWIPVIVLSVPTMLWIQVFGVHDGTPAWERKDGFWNQTLHWADATGSHISPFAYKDSIGANWYPYVPSSWTIPMEYYGSVVVYLVLMVVGRVDSYSTRLLTIGGLAFYALHRGSWFVSNFLVGLGLADYTLQCSTAAIAAEKNGTARLSRYRSRLAALWYWVLFFFALYIGGAPPKNIAFDFHPVEKIGYEWLYKLYPPITLFRIQEDTRWYWSWTGNLAVLSVTKLPILQRICNTKFVQWLGKLSFSFYLIHPFFIAILADPMDWLCSWISGNKGFQGIVTFIVVTFFSVVGAGFMERWVDAPSVRFAKRLESWFFQKRDGREVLLGSLARPLFSEEQEEEGLQNGRAMD